MSNIPDKIDSKFRYVLLAAQRAEQLMRGARPHTAAVQKAEAAGGKKATRVAQTEVGDGMVEWEYGPEPSEATGEPVEAAAASEEEVH